MKLFGKISEKTARALTFLFLSAGCVLLLVALLLSQLASKGTTVTTYSMGSYVQQTIYGGNEAQAAENGAQAVAALEDLISWRVEGSDIARLNESTGSDFITVEATTYQLLQQALEVSQASEEKFSVTIAPLSQLWDFDENPHLPEPDLITAMLPYVDDEALSLQENNTVALQKKGMGLDLGGLGKGAACDAAVASYRESGVHRGVVAVGGSVGVYGEKPFGKPWNIAVRNPAGEGSLGGSSLGELQIRSGFVSTSGSYEKQFTQNGESYHHLLDPQTGYPAETGLWSVTVWSEQGALSDALSTACFVLGQEKSLALLDRFGAGAIFISTNGEIKVTENLSDGFLLQSPDFTVVDTL